MTAALQAANLSASSPCSTTSAMTGGSYQYITNTCAQVVLGGNSDTVLPNPPCPVGTWCNHLGTLGTTLVPCPTGSLCLVLTDFTMWQQTSSGGTNGACHTIHNGSEGSVTICVGFAGGMNVLTLGTYLQQGVQLQPGGNGTVAGSNKVGHYHDPYAPTGLYPDMKATWCPTNQGPTDAQIIDPLNAVWGLPTPDPTWYPLSSSGLPLNCFDNTLFNISGVEYQGANSAPSHNSAGVLKDTGAIPWITPPPSPTSGPTATPVPTATPIPIPSHSPIPCRGRICGGGPP